jgi:nucleoside triphosphate pyrophosphatase
MAASLLLASASPRRRELLAKLGVDFEVLASEVAEEPRPGESGEAFACRTAREKAVEVAARRPSHWVLAADTVVVRDGDILGKPLDGSDAAQMLRRLSGRTHQVLTAVALYAPGGMPVAEAVVRSEVTFRAIADTEITTYLDTGEPFDKAGAYAIQGHAGRFVVQVVGSYTNVVGLPLDEVRDLLQRHGLLTMAARKAARSA